MNPKKTSLEVLSARKIGGKKELPIRVKAGVKAKHLETVIKTKVDGVVVMIRGKRTQPTLFHIMDLEWDEKQREK